MGGMLAFALMVVMALGACTYEGRPSDPLSRRLSYFSFVRADDLRAACTADANEHYRLIYNGVYGAQVRAYELRLEPDGDALLESEVFGGKAVGVGSVSFALANWPFSQAHLTAPLAPTDAAALIAALRQAGFFDAPPIGLELWSDDYYWAVSGCVRGVFQSNAYLFPSARFAALELTPLLENLDQTGIAFAVPVEDDLKAAGHRYRPGHAEESGARGLFRFRVGAQGIE
jgi:hypothetical protein